MSKMDLFIDIELKSDEYLREITQEQYLGYLEKYKDTAYKTRMCDLHIWKNCLEDLNYPPHPLKEVMFLEDWYLTWESGEEWGFIFQFKHKGKYYLYVDCGGT